MSHHEEERWFALYKAALFELDQSVLANRIQDVRNAIADRIMQLQTTGGEHNVEMLAIYDAKTGLHCLEQEMGRRRAG
jgi:hypothetical protein